MTLSDIEKIPRDYLNPEDVAEVLDMKPYSINLQAKDNQEKLGFPVIVTGTRVRIPKEGFLYFMRHGRPQAEPPAAWIERLRKEALEVIQQKEVAL
jgi:hypothetical protein